MSTVVFGERAEEPLSPGVMLDRIKPGGKDGPNGEVLEQPQGGRTWMYEWVLGDPQDAFQLAIPDIRMPANQYWPLHWHNCWLAVVIIDGSCLVGDWWMQPGDVLISRAELEYGPVVPGPRGVQLFEIFAQTQLRNGGYAPEYFDHPTLAGQEMFNFVERSPQNRRNEGRQVLPIDGVEGLFKGRLAPGAVFDLGEPDDPERGVMLYTELQPEQEIAPHSYGDARAVFVFEGELAVGDCTLVKNDVISIARGAAVPAMKAGPRGSRLLEVTRTSAGLDRRTI